MPRLQIDIRDLPEGAHERLLAVAHERRQSMTAFVRDELIALAERLCAPRPDAMRSAEPVEGVARPPWERA